MLKSSTSYTTVLSVNLGGSDSTLVPGDYDGDGMADVAVFHRSTSIWVTRTSSTGFASGPSRTLGGYGTVPVSGYDFDGDHKADIVIYLAAPSAWIVATSSSSYASTVSYAFGTSTDTPMSSVVLPARGRDIRAGDFDGDFRSDITVYHAVTGVWSILKSSADFAGASSTGWGGAGYSPAPGDYDGDGGRSRGTSVDRALAGPAVVNQLHDRPVEERRWPGYIPVPGDYDGDGKTDLVVTTTTACGSD